MPWRFLTEYRQPHDSRKHSAMKITEKHTLLQAIILKEWKSHISRKTECKLAEKAVACLDNPNDGVRQLEEALSHLNRPSLRPPGPPAKFMADLIVRVLNVGGHKRESHS